MPVCSWFNASASFSHPSLESFPAFSMTSAPFATFSTSAFASFLLISSAFTLATLPEKFPSDAWISRIIHFVSFSVPEPGIPVITTFPVYAERLISSSAATSWRIARLVGMNWAKSLRSAFVMLRTRSAACCWDTRSCSRFSSPEASGCGVGASWRDALVSSVAGAPILSGAACFA